MIMNIIVVITIGILAVSIIMTMTLLNTETLNPKPYTIMRALGPESWSTLSCSACSSKSNALT